MTIIGTTARFKNAARSPSARSKPGRASDYIAHLHDLLASGLLLVVLYCRVSSDEQAANGNLHEQVMDAWQALRNAGIRPIKVFDVVETSRVHGNRSILEQALDYARQHGAIVVAMSRDRLIRSSSFGKGQTAECEPPADAEYCALIRLADGVSLATIMHPDSSDVRSEQTKRGQRAKGNRGGRPPKAISKPGDKKRRREELKPRAKNLRMHGLSLRDIGAELGVAESTARRWI